MAELDFNEIFAVDEAETEPEVAEPVDTTDGIESSAKESDVADQNEIDYEEPEEYDDNDEGQSPEENSRYAAARRKAERERDEAVAQARLQARQEAENALNASIKEMGLVNPYTNEPIETQAQLNDYNKRLNEERRSKLQKKAGLSDEDMETFLAGQPEVKEARRLKAQAEAARRDAEEQQIQARVDRQIESINKIDPSIKSINDILNMPNYKEFRDAVEKHHLDFYEAYKFVNMDALLGQSTSAAKQSALNNMNGKNHMTRAKAHGSATLPDVPKDVYRQYKMFMPDISDEEIRKDYARNHVE